MATDEEIQRLILQVDGVDRVKELNGALDQEREKLRALLDALHAGRIGLDTFGNAAGPVAERMVDMQKKIDDLTGASGGRGRGRGLMGASYAFQDFMSVLTMGGGVERALLGVTNNVDQLATAAGASAATAAKLSIAFTGFVSVLPALIPLFQQLWQAVAGGEAAEEAQKKLEALKKEFDALINAPTKSEKAGLDALKESVTEGPSEAVFKGIAEAVTATPGLRSDFTPGEERELARLRSMQANYRRSGQASPEQDRAIAAIEQARSGRDRERARDLMTSMLHADEHGVSSLRTVRGIVDANPSAFPAGFLKDVEDALPENRRAQEALERQGALNAANMANQARIRDEERRRVEQQKALDIQGRKNAQAYDRQQDQKREREEAQAAAQAERDLGQSNNAYIRSAPRRRRRELRPAIAATSQSLGFGTPNDHQADQIAQQVIGLTQQGVGTNQAILSAVMDKAQQIGQLQMQLARQQAEAQRLMMGGDQSGQFSMMPAGPF